MKHENIGVGHIHRYDLTNFKGRYFFTTDIHGCFDLLHEAMRELAFDTTRDIIFVGGDNVDRGGDSKYILDYINEPWFISIQGNHEALFIDAFECEWSPESGAVHTLKAHGGDWIWNMSDSEKLNIYESFKSLPLGLELITPIGNIGIVHAEVPYNDWDQFKGITKAELDWDGKTTAQWARSWYSRRYNGNVKGIDMVLAGHTPTDTGNVEKLGNMVFCDAGSFFRDKLNLIELTNFEV
jgi:serine/threonine protein phosphatase 1